MSNTRVTLASVLTTVQTTAQTLTDTMSTVNKGVGMINTLVTDAADKQKINSVLRMASFKEEAIRQAAYEEVESDLRVKKFCLQSTDHADSYKASYDRFTKLLNPA